MLRSFSIANRTVISLTTSTATTTDSSSTRCSVLITKIFVIKRTTCFYPLSDSNRFTSYWFPATFSSLVASPFSYSPTPLPAVWSPGIPSLPVWRGTIPNRLFAITSILAAAQVFIDPSFESHAVPTFSGCLSFFVVVDSEDARYHFYLCGRQAWIIILDPQASNNSKHELLPGREGGCSENNSFPPKVWTLDAFAEWNERAANQLLPLPLRTWRRCTPITHITAVYNPHLQALLLKRYNNREQQARWTVHARRIENIPCPAPSVWMARQRSAGAEDAFLPRWQHVPTAPSRAGTPRERPGVGRRWAEWGHDTFSKRRCRNVCSYLHQEWLIGSVHRNSRAPKQSVLSPNSVNSLLQNWQTRLLFPAVDKRTPQPSSA